MVTNYVNNKFLEEHNTCLFKWSFYNKQAKKVEVVMIPNAFFDIQKRQECQQVFKKKGLNEYFQLPPWGVDVHRSYELMTYINQDGVAKMTRHEEKK